MSSAQRLARTAGLYYLVVAVLGAFAHIVRAQVYVAGDAATTSANVVANPDLVRYSFAADLVQATFLVFVVMTLYRLLRHVGENVARAMVIFVVIAVAIICLNMVHQLGALLLATDPSYTAAFGGDQGAALVHPLLDLQHHGYLVAQIFFGLWLFPLGLLAWRSGMIPRPIAVLLMLASTAYLVDVALQFLAPGLAATVNPGLVVVFVLAECSMLVFLLAKGVKDVRPATHELVAA